MRTAAVILSAIGIILFAGCKKNHAPDAPAVPSGPSSCAVGVSYALTSSAADPDGDSVAIRFDGDDGGTSDWSEYVPAGDAVTMSHAWASPGGFNITAQARDRVALAWSADHSLAVYIEWARTFGETGYDGGYSAQETSDGGYIVAGTTHSLGVVWLIKTDAYGNKVWDRTFGEATGIGRSVQETSDGGYIVACEGEGDLWLIKTDANGDTAWTKAFGGMSYDVGNSVQQTSDGGYVIAGTWSDLTVLADVWLVKTDSFGNEVWSKTFGGTSSDKGSSVRQTLDGGYIVAGTTHSYGAGEEDVWLIKTDANGDTVWTRTFGGTPNDVAGSAQQTQDGGYIVVGYTESYGAGGGDVWLIKADAAGNKVWGRTYGGANGDVGWSVQQTSDGGYVIAGMTSSYGAGGGDLWLIKADADGNKVWDRTFGGANGDVGCSVQQTSDGGYIVAGYTYSHGAGASDAWLIKTDAEGRMESGAR